MLNIDTLFLFVFILSTLNLLSYVFVFLRTLLQNNPEPIRFSSRELFILSISVSYFLTFLIRI